MKRPPFMSGDGRHAQQPHFDRSHLGLKGLA